MKNKRGYMNQVVLGLIVMFSGNFASADGYDEGAIRRAVRSHMGELRKCYEDGLQKDNNLQGKIVLSWAITDQGESKDVATVSGINKNLDECFVRSVQKWKLAPAPKGNTHTVKNFTFALTKLPNGQYSIEIQ